MASTRRAEHAADPRSRRSAGRAAPAPAGPNEPVLVAGLALLLALVALGPLMSMSDVRYTGEGSPARQSAYVLVALVALVGVRPLTDYRRLFVMPWPFAAALLICLLSLAWSMTPTIGLRRLALTALIIWSAAVFVRHLGFTRSIAIVRIALVALLAINFLCVLLFPTVGIHQINEPDDYALVGDWRGIMVHKNFAGAITAFTALVFAFDVPKWVPRWAQIAVIALSIVFLVFTQSKTSLGMGLGAAALGLLYLRYHNRYRALVLGGLCLAALAGALVINLWRNPFAAALNDPQGFTGRSWIWATLLRYLGDHGTLGAGYGSFWNVGPQGPIYGYAKDWILKISSGHNGYLDLAIQLGVPLAVAVAALILVVPMVRLLVSPLGVGERGALLASLLLFCAGHNLTETSLMERDIVVGVVLYLTVAMIWTVTAADARAPNPPGRPAPTDKAPRRLRLSVEP